jgi:CBS domain containing-hemolysin-like protein
MLTSLIIIAISLILSAFFSGMEIAFFSANKLQVELDKNQAGFQAKILEKLTKKSAQYIATMLVGNNIALVVYGYYSGEMLMNYYHIENLLLQTLITTLIILITAEFLPKTFFQVYSNKLLRAFAFPAYVFYIIFTPISSFVIWISNFMLKTFFKTSGDEEQFSFSKVELGNYIIEQMESAENEEEIDAEIQIFQNALEFSDVRAREIMVPRTEIIAVEIHENIENLRQLFIETGRTKIIVYKSNIDEIVGYVHSFDLFKRPKTIRAVLMPVEFVPESMMINDILNLLTKKRRSVAIVLDEYGGTSGLITIEDIIEELFGEIEDEHDVQEHSEEQLDENNYIFSTRLEVDYINEKYDLDLKEDDAYETLGGLIVNHAEEIPEQDQEVLVDNYRFIILEASNNKINKVKVEIVTDKEE